MNKLQIFNNEEFGLVRTIEIDGKPYFSASDVATALGYSNPRDAISRHCKGVVKHDIPTTSGIQALSFIPEGDIYRLIIRSQLPSAERFERWVFDEVLPQIRQTGGYQMPQTYAEALRALADKAEQAERLMIENEEMKPKAEFFDAVTDSKDAIPMADVAKVLNMGIGRNKLFIFLRNNGVLQSDNRPYQRYIDNGWFRTIEQKYDKGYGETGINIKTLVFQKGVDGIRKLLLKEG
jgi:prophage antirepressor-like protein